MIESLEASRLHLLTRSGQCLWQLDRRGVVQDVEGAAESTTALPAPKLLGTPIFDHMAAPDADSCRADYDRFLDRGEQELVTTWRFHPGQTLAAYIERLAPRATRDAGDTSGCLVLTLDRTDAVHWQHAVKRLEHRYDQVAAEIHDGLAQLVAGAKMLVEGFIASQVAAPDELTRATALLADASNEARALIDRQRPPRLAGQDIAEALGRLTRDQRTRYALDIDLAFDGDPSDLSTDIEDALYRIAQESITNARRHGGAHRVSLILRTAVDRVEMHIDDDGRGFSPSAAPLGVGFGLEAMRRRAEQLGGSLAIESAPGAGSRISVRIPVPPRHAISM